MKGIKSFYTGSLLLAIIIFCSCLIGQKIQVEHLKKIYQQNEVVDTDFGNFLAAQHALYINDFKAAQELLSAVKDDIGVAKNERILASFFSGNMPKEVDSLKDSKDLSLRFIYDVSLVQKGDWKNLYKRHESDKSLLFAPLRIFSAVKQGKTKEAIKFVDSTDTSDSWKAFIKGQIAVINKDVNLAAKEFANVLPEFMSLSDYLYLMSFYRENEMFEDMEILKNDFTSKPGGMYVLDYPEIPEWKYFDGIKNNLAFSMIQSVSHTQVIIFTDISLMLLRFAESVAENPDMDSLNYYLGQYYFYNKGQYKKCFNNISKKSPLHLFGQMKIAGKNNDFKFIKKIAKQNPLFLPATNMALNYHIKNGEKNAALTIVNRALKQDNLNDKARAYFLKKRANIYLMFDNPKKAQKDLDRIFEIENPMATDNLLLQARIWNQSNKNLQEAYNYSMMVIHRNTSNVQAWDLLGCIVRKQEGIDEALSIMNRVSEIATNVSSLYEHLGDFYMEKGLKDKARESYEQAIDLSEDGLIVVPFVQKKLRKVK